MSFAMKDVPGDCEIILAVPEQHEHYNQLKIAFGLTRILKGSTFCDHPVTFEKVYSCTPF
jgi:hypothetical protein